MTDDWGLMTSELTTDDSRLTTDDWRLTTSELTTNDSRLTTDDWGLMTSDLYDFVYTVLRFSSPFGV